MTTPSPVSDVSEPLVRDYAIECLALLASYADSAAIALDRGSDELAVLHCDQIRLIWREIAVSMNALRSIPPSGAKREAA